MNSSNRAQEQEDAMQVLIKVVSELRDPAKGCPWDLEQTHKSLIPFVLEEAYEVAHAIRLGDSKELKEELGDLLLQIVLHAQIATESNNFNLNDVAEGIVEKLIRRHPHVFKEKTRLTTEKVKESWEEIKSIELDSKYSQKHSFSDKLKSKIKSQSASNSALIISKRVSKIGFEWKSADVIWNKLQEEINELKEALNEGSMKNAETELGDVLFTLINIARWYELNPEEALNQSNKKFVDRIRYIEKITHGDFNNITQENLGAYWKKAKKYLSETINCDES